MTKRYFGTDGVRGQANEFPMTPEIAMRFGMAAGTFFRRRREGRHLAVVGKDTRLSGYMIEPALTAGFSAVGMDVRLLGPIPTPGVARITRSLRADLGVMITASHNPFQDNGLKLFGPNGHKLDDGDELEIERLMDEEVETFRAGPSQLGRVQRIDDAIGRYIEVTKAAFPRGLTLAGLRIVVDCAHGASYRAAPAVLYELGAEVIAIGDEPDGFNINDHCGSTHPEQLIATVKERKADLGIALDGDADRVVLIDQHGTIVDGDQILGLIGSSWMRAGRLRGGGIVSTVMSNLGLERYLDSHKLRLERTAVGDRYVVQHMRDHGFNVGGEQSGHIVLTDHSTTGDGLVAALQVLAEMIAASRPASEILSVFEPMPQILKNVRFEGDSPLEIESVSTCIENARVRLGNGGRLLIRKSGTEPLIRVMAEGEDEVVIATLVDEIIDQISRAKMSIRPTEQH